jgi:predicted aconitase with swiveling domain
MNKPASTDITGRKDSDNVIAQHITSSAHILAPGHASGEILALEPLSFWGGYDAAHGKIIDKSHSCHGKSLAGMIMVMPLAKGSSSSSSVLAEAIRNGTGPSGIVLREPDLIISIGVIVANELYGVSIPLVVVDDGIFDALCRSTQTIQIDAPREADLARIEIVPRTTS